MLAYFKVRRLYSFSSLKARMFHFKCRKVQESVAKTNRFTLSLELSLPAFPLPFPFRSRDLCAY